MSNVKCIISISNKDLSNDVKAYKKIFKSLDMQDGDSITVRLRPHSTIVDLFIETLRLDFFLDICKALITSKIESSKVVYSLLLEVFKLQTGRIPKSCDKFDVWANISNVDGIENWIIYPIDIKYYKIDESGVEGSVDGVEISRSIVEYISSSVVRYEYDEREFVINYLEEDLSSIINRVEIDILMLLNMGVYKHKSSLTINTRDGKYRLDCKFHGTK